jgi:hypothetical protein
VKKQAEALLASIMEELAACRKTPRSKGYFPLAELLSAGRISVE